MRKNRIDFFKALILLESFKVNRVKNQFQKIIIVLVIFSLAGCASLGTKSSGSFVQSEDKVDIHYSDDGQGEIALVFVHGWMCDSGYWQDQIDYFKSKYRVVAVDLAGHGQSSLVREDYSIENFAGDVAVVVNHLQLDKIILVGHSMGGPVVVEAATRLSDKTIGVVAVDSFATGYQWPEKNKIPEVIAPYRENFANETYKMASSMFSPTTDQSLVDEISSDMASGPEEVGISAFTRMLEWVANDYQSARENLSKPFVHINALHKNMPIIRDKIVIVPDVGHFIPQEAPKQFNAALEQAVFLMQ